MGLRRAPEGRAGIQALPANVVRGIAAGEVIERPASALKELLENALDAGARRIEVDLEQGGKALVRVRDDGAGIPPGELLLAVAPHATSKLRGLSDLERLGSFGFRGEALASLARISELRILSRAAGRDDGAEIRVRFGTEEPVRPLPLAPGTIVEARDLFQGLPARRKFLKGAPAEFSRCEEAFLRAAFVRPEVSFRLRHNGREIRSFPAGGEPAERARAILGRDPADAGTPLNAVEGELALRGFIFEPSRERARTPPASWFVNDRPIRDRMLARLLPHAAEGLFSRDRLPSAVVSFRLPGTEVDVNVHPAKSEVRFRESRGLYAFLLRILREALRRMAVEPDRAFEPTPRTSESCGPAPEPRGTSAPAGGPRTYGEPSAEMEAKRPSLFAAAESAGRPRPVLQLHRTYLVRETPGGFSIADQHALHERIILESLLQAWAAGVPSQRLLSPIPVALDAEARSAILEQADALRRAGLSIEALDGEAVLLRSLPAVAADREPTSFLKGLASDLRDAPISPVEGGRGILERIACRSALKAGMEIGSAEATCLLGAVSSIPNACAHGRPVQFEISLREIERRFGRA